MKKLLFLFFILLGCVPAQKPSENNVLPALLSIAYRPAPPENVQTHLVDTLFPKTGPYALIEGEKEYLLYSMYERYNDGFYEPLAQPLIALDMSTIMKEAFEKDGTTMASLNADYEKEIKRVLTTAPEFILWNIRFTTANSAIMSAEMLTQEGFFEGELKKEDFEQNKTFMLNLYNLVSDEIQRRKTP
ncbi:MAG: hypothetical protein IPL26_28375 [Leptospiraceae bacterium]|nr:hypothetical protein [Leptospiraceae bacterium]